MMRALLFPVILLAWSFAALGQDRSLSTQAEACFASSSSITAEEIGVNRTNLGRVKDFLPILVRMHDAGIRDVRLTLDPPLDNSIATIAAANRLGMKVLLNVPTWWPEVMVQGAVRRPGRPGRHGTAFYDIYRLSDLDITRYKSWFADVVRKIEIAGGQVDAFEIGNEINWAGFNGDLPLAAPGHLYALDNIAQYPEIRKIEEGFRKYAEALAATRAVLHAHSRYRNTPIITAGLTGAEADSGTVSRGGAGVASFSLSMSYYLKYGALVQADGIAVHVYPAITARDEKGQFLQTFAAIEKATRLCAEGQKVKSNLSCWITEWGFRSLGDACTMDDKARATKMREFAAAVGCLAKTRRIHTAYLYDWDASSDYSIWRCNRLLEGGKALQLQ